MTKFINMLLKTALCVVMMCALYLPVNAGSNIEQEFEFACDFLEDYYLNVDMKYDCDFLKYTDSKVLARYIQQKAEACRQCRDCDITAHKVSFELKDSEELDGCIKLVIASRIDFKYDGADCESCIGEVSQLLISQKDGKLNLCDWYASSICGYDEALRGSELDICDPRFWESPEAQMLIIQDHEGNSSSEEDILINTADSSITTGRIIGRWLYPINKTAIVYWARQNFDSAQPQSGNLRYVWEYYDFGQIPGSYDCTNFVSHAILAGGAPTNESGSGISPTGWFFRGLNDRSHSWSGVIGLYDFLTGNQTRGPVGAAAEYRDIYPGSREFEAGDVMQFHNGDFWRHSGVITGFLRKPSGELEALITGRTSDGVYNDNTRQSEIYPGSPRRVIRILGYYE